MRLAIMQPYFFPYIGYFQLIRAVDLFVIYDNVQYTKKGWINRNRILEQGREALISLPLKKASDFLDVRDRELASDFRKDKLRNRIREAYRRAPCFPQAFPVVDGALGHPDGNLFRFLLHTIRTVCAYLGIGTEVAISSTLPVDHTLRGQDRVIALCRQVGAREYVNPIGGQSLYSREHFFSQGIDLKFLQPEIIPYTQAGNDFIPSLSIIDVMMFNSAEDISRRLVSEYHLI
ncbi:WbqC family protein [Accumulibacter sp.]|uniref:WbqC family protein n=1 Tax=Accumulibacter sp. TaxID=2053492 RepID=UPI002637D5E2|nr:WbqC family protein [Accumulibacter sp.]